MRTIQNYIFLPIFFLLSACGNNKKVDVSNIPVNVKMQRFDDAFDGLQKPPFALKITAIQNKYGLFYQDFVQRILKAGSIADTSYYIRIKQIVNSKPYHDLKHEVDSIFPNLEKQNAELTDAFRRVKYYFPKKQLPKIYTYVSGFEAQTAVGDGYIGVGLDLFLGAGSKFYPAIITAYPRYLSQFFTPQNLAPRVTEGLLREDMFREPAQNQTFLQKMIYNGKIMYAMDLLLPDAGDTTKIRYTTAQLQWCQKFEPQIWGYFLEQNLLYSSDLLKNQAYFDEAPFTSGLGEGNESAPKLGTWAGWQIVRKYMDKHPDVTLAQLMADEDAQKILNQSKYRPK